LHVIPIRGILFGLGGRHMENPSSLEIEGHYVD